MTRSSPLEQTRQNRFGLRVTMLLSYAVFTEVAQTWIPDRQFQWPDLLANLLGITSGLLLSRLFHSSTSRATS